MFQLSSHIGKNDMKLLIAPIHYVISKEGGSEYSRAFDAVDALSKDKTYSGDVLVGYSAKNAVGNFKIHSMLKSSPKYISNLMRIRFIVWVYVKSIIFLRKGPYDCVWHYGPFSIGETFSLLALSRFIRPPMVIGPILSPFSLPFTGDFGQFGAKHTKRAASLRVKVRVDAFLYNSLAKYFGYLSVKTLKTADRVLAMESNSKNILSKKGIGSVDVLTLGVKDPIMKQLKSKKNLNSKTLHLLSVSYLIPRKRVEDLIRAVALLNSKKGPLKIHLTVVGDGSQKEYLTSLSDKLQLTECVSFSGYVKRSDIEKYYSNADVFLSGSIAESMPGMYFEAMSFGLPMILASNSTSKELGRKHFGGFVVPKYNPRAIAEKIELLANNKGLLKSLGERNLQMMKNEYNFTLQIGKLKRLFLEVSK